MIQAKKNKCKGIGKALGYGCSKIDFRYKFGLCRICFFNWLNNTKEGQDYSPRLIKAALNKVKKDKPKRKYIKWWEKDTNDMINYVQESLCNPYIRLRDYENFERCISTNGVIEHAGHCFSCGSNPGLRFNIMNIHGQQAQANTHLHGDFHNYKEGLIKRHGEKYFKDLEKLKIKASATKQLDRLEVIRIGKTYAWLVKNKVWCFNDVEFQNYKNLINK